MIYNQAALQFNQMKEADRNKIKTAVAVFSASEDNIITHFHNGIMAIYNPNGGYPKMTKTNK